MFRVFSFSPLCSAEFLAQYARGAVLAIPNAVALYCTLTTQPLSLPRAHYRSSGTNGYNDTTLVAKGLQFTADTKIHLAKRRARRVLEDEGVMSRKPHPIVRLFIVFSRNFSTLERGSGADSNRAVRGTLRSEQRSRPVLCVGEY